MSVYYVDTSAALKLLADESHSKPFAEFYDSHANDAWVSSTLLRVEVMRAVIRALPVAIPDARELLHAFDFISIDEGVIDVAMNEQDRTLRSLDAIHLASARALGADLDGIATYDDRVAGAAMSAGMTIISPRD